MIRPLTIATFLMASGSGLYLYQSKHEAQVLDRTIERTVHETAAFREQSRLLVAEWTMLNDPESLRRFSNAYLALKTITPAQFTSLADLDGRLPPVPPPPSAHDPDEVDPVPIAGVLGTDPPVRGAAQAAPVPAAGSDNDARARPGDDARARPRSVAAPLAATALGTPAQPPNRKVAIAKPSTADAASKAAAAQPGDRSSGPDALGKRLVTDAAPSARAVAGADPRNAEQHSNEQRLADQRPPQPADARSADPKVTEVRSALPLPQPRPVVAAAARPPPVGSLVAAAPTNLATANIVSADPAIAGRLPAQGTAQTQAQTPRSGSLLGMAQGSASLPAPRPTPVPVNQW